MFEFINHNAGIITLFCTVLVAIATSIYVILTRRLVNVTTELKNVQTRPELSISILPRDPEVWIVDMIIENVGNGAAHNIEIKPDANFEMRTDRNFDNIGFVKNGYKYFAPHQKIKFFFTSLIDNREEKRNVDFNIKVDYEDYAGKKYENSFKINLSEFYGIPRYGNPPLYEIAESLKKIEKSISDIIKEKLGVNVYTEEDRIKIDKEKQKKLEEEYRRRKELNKF